MKNSNFITYLLLISGFIAATATPDAIFAAEEEVMEELVVTGSRITKKGLVSSSPIYSVDFEEISLQQETELANILRKLPSTIPGDGENVNNGTRGASTVDLRGLGPERNLVLMNGRRITPFNQVGQVDTSSIPVALVERVDIITGGASAVYGSDAIAGAVNIIMRNDFQGFDFRTTTSETNHNDGNIENISLTLGSALDDGRGNVAINMSWANRTGVLLGDRDLGKLGIDTASGANLAEFKAGLGPQAPPANCGGPDVAATGGSTTSIPTRLAIAGAGSVGQFQEDRTLFIGDVGTGLGPRGGCSVFNFNPFNYYRTPSERFNAMMIGNFEFSDRFEAYTSIEYSNVTVDAQVAPSGTFGALFDVPLANPFFEASALAELLSFANTAVGDGTLSAGTTGSNWNDVNANGVVDSDDYLKLQLRRRTVELGPRSERWDNEHFTFLAGARGELYGDWGYDISFQYGESNRTTVRDGYTNLTNIQNALDSIDGVTCANGDSTCVPIDLFGGFGTITSDMAGYARAIALQQQKYNQRIGTILVDGPIEAIQLPWAISPISLSVGYEHRDENAELNPDECLKLAPASCQGGAGGNLLPISGSFKVEEIFFEGYLPLIEDKSLAQSLILEFGFRNANYDAVDTNDTWKLGLNWRPVDQLLFRVMRQEATRAPNIGELFSPITTGLDNATLDPCSIANAGNITPELSAICVSTGMLLAQVGSVQDIVSGQINTLDGSDPVNPPNSETAETLTIGFVWTPSFEMLPGLNISVDYYDIDIEDVIGEFSAQEVLDQCYVAGNPAACANMVRVNGDFTAPSSGVRLLTTNLEFRRAEGIEIGFGFGLDLGEFGDLQFSGTINKYLTQESQSSALTPVLDCKGFYGTSCDPVSDLRWVQRTTWNFRDLTLSLQWRHINSIDVETPEAAATFVEFRSIDDYNYLDLYADYSLWDDKIKLTLGINNLTDEDPPVVGNESGDTSSNSGNTYPSNYDVLGRVYTFGVGITL